MRYIPCAIVYLYKHLATIVSDVFEGNEAINLSVTRTYTPYNFLEVFS